MNPEQALEAVARAIENRGTHATKRWAIVWKRGEFLCVPIMTANTFGSVFMTFTDLEATGGLTNHQWDHLLYTISTFLKQKGLL